MSDGCFPVYHHLFITLMCKMNFQHELRNQKEEVTQRKEETRTSDYISERGYLFDSRM